MPSIAAHFACADLVYKRLHNKSINKDKFYIGCILPDIIDDNDSHYKTKGKYYLVPDIKKYQKETKLDKDIQKGYLCHLLLDNYFLDEYVIQNIKDYNKINLFSEHMIYSDYTNINSSLVEKFNINLNYINKIMIELKRTNKINIKKYNLNVESINNLKGGEIKYIDIDNLESFIKRISIKITTNIIEN